MKNPLDYHAVDATATLRLLQLAKDAGVKRIIYASTSAIYGEAPEQPKVETMRGLPISPYGIAKYAGELYMTAFAALHRQQTISLRYFNVFGPGQDPKSQYGAAVPSIVSKILSGERPTIYGDAVPSIVSKILSGERPTIYGDGEQTRDFVTSPTSCTPICLPLKLQICRAKWSTSGAGDALRSIALSSWPTNF